MQVGLNEIYITLFYFVNRNLFNIITTNVDIHMHIRERIYVVINFCLRHAVIEKNNRFESYRLISNLSVIFKLLERAVSKQLVKYLKDNDLLPNRRSAYTVNHSTETEVLKVLADILLALDSGDLALLTLLDLSAACDSVDHGTLLRRLQTSDGLN